jgi:hypothetical protein
MGYILCEAEQIGLREMLAADRGGKMEAWACAQFRHQEFRRWRRSLKLAGFA